MLRDSELIFNYEPKTESGNEIKRKVIENLFEFQKELTRQDIKNIYEGQNTKNGEVCETISNNMRKYKQKKEMEQIMICLESIDSSITPVQRKSGIQEIKTIDNKQKNKAENEMKKENDNNEKS